MRSPRPLNADVIQTMANPYAQVIELLRAATLEPAKLPEAIKALQAIVWKAKDWESDIAPDIVEVLSDLAYDLDFYEPDAAARAEDPSYFADDRAIQEIVDALARISRV